MCCYATRAITLCRIPETNLEQLLMSLESVGRLKTTEAWIL